MALQSLFDVIYSSISEPERNQAQKLANEDSRIRIKADQIALDNQMAFQKAMTSIFPNGVSSDIFEQAAGGDPTAKAKMQALNAAYMQYAPDKIPQLMSSMQNASQKQEKLIEEQQKRMGSLFATVDGADSYQAIFPEIQAMGGFQRFGLTGDFSKDQGRIRALGLAGMTAGQQARMDFQQQQEARRVQEDAAKQQRADEMQKFRDTVHADLEKQRAEINAERARQDAIRQNVNDDKDKRALAAQRERIGRVTKDDRQVAAMFIDQYESPNIGSLKNLPANVKKQLTDDLVRMTKADLARGMTSDESVPDDEAFTDALNRNLTKLLKQNKVVSSYSTFGGFQIPFTGKTEYRPASGGPAAIPKPAASAAPASTGYTPQQGALIERAMKANPAYSRAEVIEELKKKGAL